MSSILTDIGAMVALQTMKDANARMATVRTEISTGKSISTAKDNARLWSTLGADVADPGNGLPQKLRAQLYYLFEFTAQHSRLVLDGSAGAEVLIDINTAVMRGLRGANEVAA